MENQKQFGPFIVEMEEEQQKLHRPICEYQEAQKALLITGGKYSLNQKELTIRNAEDRAADASIVILGSVYVTLAGVNIDCSHTNRAAFEIAGYGDPCKRVTVNLKENTRNILRSGSGHAGLEKNGLNSGKLTICGKGSLDAYGTGGGAGIGGGNGANVFDITITGGIIKADSTFLHGWGGGAGIGGGVGGIASGIEINGGFLSVSSEGGMGIGDGLADMFYYLGTVFHPNCIQGGVIYSAAHDEEFEPCDDSDTLKLAPIPSIRSRNSVLMNGGYVEAQLDEGKDGLSVSGGIVRNVTPEEKTVDRYKHFEEYDPADDDIPGPTPRYRDGFNDGRWNGGDDDDWRDVPWDGESGW